VPIPGTRVFSSSDINESQPPRIGLGDLFPEKSGFQKFRVGAETSMTPFSVRICPRFQRENRRSIRGVSKPLPAGQSIVREHREPATRVKPDAGDESSSSMMPKDRRCLFPDRKKGRFKAFLVKSKVRLALPTGYGYRRNREPRRKDKGRRRDRTSERDGCDRYLIVPVLKGFVETMQTVFSSMPWIRACTSSVCRGGKGFTTGAACSKVGFSLTADLLSVSETAYPLPR
jgi:hypothetical protein